MIRTSLNDVYRESSYLLHIECDLFFLRFKRNKSVTLFSFNCLVLLHRLPLLKAPFLLRQTIQTCSNSWNVLWSLEPPGNTQRPVTDARTFRTFSFYKLADVGPCPMGHFAVMDPHLNGWRRLLPMDIWKNDVRSAEMQLKCYKYFDENNGVIEFRCKHINLQSFPYLGFPRRAAWWRALKPLLFVRVMSAMWSKRRVRISSRFLEIASWSGVSPSWSWKYFLKSWSTHVCIPYLYMYLCLCLCICLSVSLCICVSMYQNNKKINSTKLNDRMCATSPSLQTWRLGWPPSSRSIFTTPTWPLFTATWRGVCRRLLRALRSAAELARIWTTPGSSPYAAWWIARSPSLSWKRLLKHKVGCIFTVRYDMRKGLPISRQHTYKEYITYLNKHIKIIMNSQNKVKWNASYSLF